MCELLQYRYVLSGYRNSLSTPGDVRPKGRAIYIGRSRAQPHQEEVGPRHKLSFHKQKNRGEILLQTNSLPYFKILWLFRGNRPPQISKMCVLFLFVIRVFDYFKSPIYIDFNALTKSWAFLNYYGNKYSTTLKSICLNNYNMCL